MRYYCYNHKYINTYYRNYTHTHTHTRTHTSLNQSKDLRLMGIWRIEALGWEQGAGTRPFPRPHTNRNNIEPPYMRIICMFLHLYSISISICITSYHCTSSIFHAVDSFMTPTLILWKRELCPTLSPNISEHEFADKACWPCKYQQIPAETSKS